VRTAIVVPFPEASGVVDGWLEKTCPARPSIGVPAHVTIVFPFVPAELVDDSTLSELDAVIAATPAFEVAFRRTGRFPDVLYLAPEPVEPFVALTSGVVARWPEHPPYEGAFDAVVPHLTVACGDGEILDTADADVTGALPIEAVANEALLLEEIEPESVRWGARASFRFGS
jgi:2'-5' RNA ligase